MVVGIGGVGGYYGGKLANYYEYNDECDVYFVARGQHLEQIQNHGLQVHTAHGSFNAHPTLTTDDPGLLGPMDLILLCTKTYDLEQSVELIRQNVGSDTVILPLLNGVGISEQVTDLLTLPAQVLHGLVYVTSYISKPGEVTQYGTYDKLLFGSSVLTPAMLNRILHIFQQAGIKALIVQDIEVQIWTKYLLISSIASITSYKQRSIGAMREDNSAMEDLKSMMLEVKNLAASRNINLPHNIVAKTIDKVGAFNYDAKSSMQLDFEKGKKTELDALTGYIYLESEKVGLQAPVSKRIYQALKSINH